MSIFKKIFKFGKKGAGKARPQSGGAPQKWPPGVKIGIYGHSNSGKTVYYTVLNEDTKVSRNLQLSITDNATAGEFLANYRALWGLGTASDVGTVVDLKGERKFPDLTSGEKILKFTAIVDRDTKVPVVAYDYPGKAVHIAERSDVKDRVLDFMTEADGILFFFDPKVMGAEARCQEHVASIINMLELLAPLKARIPIPVGLVITKADILPGFKGEGQTVLIPPDSEHILADDFDSFLDRVLSHNKVSSNPEWAGTVRDVLVKLRDFIHVVVGRTLNFQIFFISNTGEEPQKIGSDIGRSLYQPPDRMAPTGVREPFYWILKSIVRNRKISRLRSIAKAVAALSLIWIVLFSMPFAMHYWWSLDNALDNERQILAPYEGSPVGASDVERRRIKDAYYDYKTGTITKWFFSEYTKPADRIWEFYDKVDFSQLAEKLDATIGRFTAIVQDSLIWPDIDPSDSTIVQSPASERFLSDLATFRTGDSTSSLYQRADRTMEYWDMFLQHMKSPGDTALANKLVSTVQYDESVLGSKERTRAEVALGEALVTLLTTKKQVQQRQETVQRATATLGTYHDRINSNSDPAFRLGEAVRLLRSIKADLGSGEERAAVDNYIDAANWWRRPHTFNYKVVAMSPDDHMHIEVVDNGKSPTWEKTHFVLPFDLTNAEESLQWEVGQEIHIAYDTLGHPEGYGRNPADKIVLDNDYALFELEGELNFKNIGRTVQISFGKRSLKDRLPELK